MSDGMGTSTSQTLPGMECVCFFTRFTLTYSMCDPVLTSVSHCAFDYDAGAVSKSD